MRVSGVYCAAENANVYTIQLTNKHIIELNGQYKNFIKDKYYH
jgi:hypothetical protein